MPTTSAERMRLKRERDSADPDRKLKKLDTIFMFGEVEVSIIVDNDGNVWFKAVDLARALEMENPNSSVCDYIDKKYCQSYEELTSSLPKYRNIPNMHPKTTFVNEAGSYAYIARSRKPNAKAFMDWIFETVLPKTKSLRETELVAREEYERHKRECLKGFVYLFTSEELKAESIYKIGHTKDVSHQLSSLNVGRCGDLLDVYLCTEVDDAVKLVKILHCMFTNCKQRGQFYELHDDDIAKIKEVMCIE